MTYFYHSVVDSPHLPRDVAGDSAQSAITTLMGEFWPPDHRVDVPSAVIVELLGRLDISEAAVRTSLSRLAKRGTLGTEKVGRTTFYRLSDAVRSSIPASERLTMTFGVTPEPWDGQWTLVAYSLPESRREQRDELREWLRWLGFGPLRDGVWISPRAPLDLVETSIRRFLPPDGLVLRSAEVLGTVDPEAIWPLRQLKSIYEAFDAEFRPAVYSLRAGSVSPIEALGLSLRLLGRWRGFPTVDPDLPSAALPADWPRAGSRRLFEAVYDAAMPLAAQAVRTIAGRHSAVAAESVRALSVAESIAEWGRLAPASESALDLTTVRPTRSRFDLPSLDAVPSP
ncbi:PaaX family transcriptional regulator C-terminal domain-containing protein [Rathayibacter sp. Leaf296]|uniref:PaaX family transcriptional regulator n=1 Tax=Rathayibacter sp. Leaf296 TaxID=1736327 RepID=UPI0007037D0C|nr:PaaX family transcriptional regulator C-terminal domain-containing protein [Rathayibacter sp. Leaf296]KQQ08492.1 hypothetical protein ASF46_14430 [Rathayibacter sp. Leaf296]